MDDFFCGEVHYWIVHQKLFGDSLSCLSYLGLSIMSNTSCCSRMNPLAGLSLLGAKFCFVFSLNRSGCARM